MRIAVSGSQGTGKSTLISAFLARCPRYVYEPEAFETLADDIDLTSDEGPTADGLRALLDLTASVLESRRPDASVVFERSPVDYLAYAAASRSWPKEIVADFLAGAIPDVRRSVRSLDLIVLLPVTRQGPPARSGESPRFRKRVDEALRRALVDDDYDIFEGGGPPTVVELPPSPARQLDELVRLAS